MKILIDGDACPVINQAIEIAKKNKIIIKIFCDTSHIFTSDYAQIVTVSKGSDNVDFALVNCVIKEDIIVTQDYGLAAMGLAKGAFVLNENGMIFNESNIELLLDSRHFYKTLRKQGIHTKGKSKRNKAQDEAFKKALENLIRL
ncbi:MAG: YaiI/YqxD family protein [Oscillospiraceae bacterium]